MNITALGRKYYIEILLILLFIGDLFLQVLPVIPLMFVTLLYVVLRCNNWERIFFFLISFPPIAGTLFNTIGISGVGGWFVVLGVAMVALALVRGDNPLRHIEKGLIPFALCMAVFIISALMTTGGNYSTSKIISTFIQGSLGILAFLVFYNNYEDFDTRKVGVFYILMSALLLRLSIITNQIPGPTNILDFGFLRAQSPLDYLDSLAFSIDYQYMGFLCVQGMGFYLMSLQDKIDIGKILILLLGSLITLYAGSRQAIVTAVAIFVLWIFLLRTGRQFGRWIVIIIGAILLYYVGSNLTNDEGLFSSVAQEGYVEGSGRSLWILRGIQLFQESPIFGVGYGRYNLLGEYGCYPHNMLLELLCETGIVGFLIIIGVAQRCIFKNKDGFRYVLFLFVAMFFRAMASAGMNDNIVLFSLLFCLPALTIKVKEKI